MSHVTALTGMPVNLVREAKRQGCTAFHGSGRIDLAELLKWFFSQYGDESESPPDGLATWREALNKVQTKREELRLAKDKGEVIDFAAARQQSDEAETYYFDELDRLVREMPAALSGLSPEQINSKLETFCEEMKRASRVKFGSVGK